MQTLVVAGAVTSGCVRASVVDAMQFGFRPLKEPARYMSVKFFEEY